MARFDVYPNPFAAERKETPFLLDVQNDHLGPLVTRVMIPLRASKGFGIPARRLNPEFEVKGMAVVLDTASLAPVPTAWLKAPVMQADGWRGDVTDALDTLFGAY
ncbi:MAG: CcdB family protein [Rubrivivax sp.]|jgi:toxin CcdB|nr:CcdB family protein [Rubrivivax sp.]